MPIIAIVGLPGSGKTTLANRMGQDMELPVTHTDVLKELPWDEQAIAALQLLQGFSGIVEGVTVQRLFRKGLVPTLTLVMPNPPNIPKTHAALISGLVRGIAECKGPLAHVRDWRIKV